jgi:hypothetical protein
MSDNGEVINVRQRPFHQRFIRSYRAWRTYGLSRTESLRGAWRISRILSTIR